MEIGVMLGEQGGVPGMVEQARRLAEEGFRQLWASQVFGVDALTALAVVGAAVPDVQLGTAVVPTYPRHPLVLAAQALTVQSVIGGRLVLGIGLSHQVVIEGAYGVSFDKPARHMREHLAVLLPALRTGQASFKGETLSGTTLAPLKVDGATPPPVLLAALAPRMLELAGGEADGTITWMTGPKTLGSHIVPSIGAAAAKAGRPAPRVAVGLPVCVTGDVEAARAAAATTFQMYGYLPSYRAMLDKEGAEGPADVAIVGDEDTVAARVRALADDGATDFCAAPFGSGSEISRTLEVLAAL